MKAFIYAIEEKTAEPNQPKKIYIGSTRKNKLKKRINNHLYDYRHYGIKDVIRYCTSYEILKKEYIYYSIVEKEFETKEEIKKEEQKQQNLYKQNNNFNCVNIIKAYQSKEERKQYDKIRHKAKTAEIMKKMTPDEKKELFEKIKQCKIKKLNQQ